MRESDGRKAAAISFAVGKHFRDRGNYTLARDVLQPWLTEGFGTERLLEQGRLAMAPVYQQMGLEDEAVPLLRDIITDFENGYERNFPDHAAMAAHLAKLTREPGDIDYALKVIAAASDAGSGDFIELYFAGQASQLNTIAGRYDEALLQAEKAVAILESQSVPVVHGAATVRMRLAQLKLYHGGDITGAQAQVEAVLGPLRETAGETRDTVSALIVSGRLAQQSGDLARALQRYDEAEALIASLNLDSSFADIGLAQMLAAEVYAEQGDTAAAQAKLQAARGFAQIDPARLALSEALVSGASLADLETPSLEAAFTLRTAAGR